MTPTRPAVQAEDIDRVSHRALGKAQGYKTAVRNLEIGATRITRTCRLAALPYFVRSTSTATSPAASRDTTAPARWPQLQARRRRAARRARASGPAPTVNPQVVRWAERSAPRCARGRPRPRQTRRQVGRGDPLRHRLVADLRALQPRPAERPRDRNRPRPDAVPWHNVERALVQPPQFVDEADLPILRTLRRLAGGRDSGRAAAERGLSATPCSRCAPPDGCGSRPRTSTAAASRPAIEQVALSGGPPRPAVVHWRRNEFAQIVPVVAVTPPAEHILPTTPPWYLDPPGRDGPARLRRSRRDLPATARAAAARRDRPAGGRGRLQQTCPDIPRRSPRAGARCAWSTRRRRRSLRSAA